jgi:hypothetical protein
MRRPWILPSLALLALLCVAASALAQGDDRFSTVLGPDSQGVTLGVRAEPDRVCVQLADENGIDSDSCADFTQPDLYGPFEIDLERAREGGPTSLGGVVRAGVARVEYVAADGRTFGTDTVAAPQLGGRAGSDLRFFLLTLPAGADAVTRRLFDAAGHLINESDDVADPGSGPAPRPLRGPVRLARGRSNGVGWNVYATVRNILEPVRGDVARRQPRLCLATSRSPSGGGSCASGPERTFSLDFSSGCPGHQASLILGIAGPGIRIEARLGDGRWRTARMLAPPASYAPSGERAWVFAIPSDSAVRAIRARAADGRVVGSELLGVPPPRVSCKNGVLFGFLTSDDEDPPALTGPEAVLTPPGGPPLRVADADAQLCVALGPAPRDRNCVLPGPNLGDVVIGFSPDGRSIGGAVDPAVAFVEARTVDGKRARVATDPGAGYAGRYAGLVRFFSLSAPGGRTIESFTLIDAAGRRLIEQPAGFEFGRTGRPRVLLRGRAAGGRYALTQASFRFTDREGPVRCLAVTRRGQTLNDPFDCLTLTQGRRHLSTRTAIGESRCDLRAVFLLGGAYRRAASVRATLDDGSTVDGRLFGSALGRAFLVSPRRAAACGGSRSSTGRASGCSATPAASRPPGRSAATTSACSPPGRERRGRCGQPYRPGWASRTRRTSQIA